MTRTKKTPSSKSISIEDVARESGVSITTVSRVINKVGTVKEKNRAKVMSVVKDLKFQPSIFAQRLATGKTNVVALVIPVNGMGFPPETVTCFFFVNDTKCIGASARSDDVFQRSLFHLGKQVRGVKLFSPDLFHTRS